VVVVVALVVDADKPFRGLNIFGGGFLGKFQSSEVNAPILENITFIDTPGVLSGEKQRHGRAYDFPKVASWFAERSDMILLLFDSNKLDISDEMRDAIDALKGHEEKIHVILNKADTINSQQLMRVYGALMWSLGKVVHTPEVMRVYIGSFWDQPYQNQDFKNLFDAEQADLLADLAALPGNGTIRKVNELVKRSRLVKVHAYIISYLREEMPAIFGKTEKHDELIATLPDVFVKLQRKYHIPAGDFPDVKKYQETLKIFDFNKLPKLNERLIEGMDEVLSTDLTELLNRFPREKDLKLNVGPQMDHKGTASPQDTAIPPADPNLWVLNPRLRQKHEKIFKSAGPEDGKLRGEVVRNLLLESGLGKSVLKQVWALADVDQDGHLDLTEFLIAMHLVDVAQHGYALPEVLPPSMLSDKR